jgi:hypothetical protein
MFIIDVYGRRVPVSAHYILKPGETLALPALFMDSATRSARASVGLTDSDAALMCDAFGAPAGHARGFVFVADAATRQRVADATAYRDAATIAYEERNSYLQAAWRRRDEQQDDGRDDQKPAPCSLADAKQRAEDAYAAKIGWLQVAWKEGRDAA